MSGKFTRGKNKPNIIVENKVVVFDTSKSVVYYIQHYGGYNTMPNLFGERFKEHRIRARQTLRAFCERNNFDAGNISKLERGQLAPPKDDAVLRRYATALQLIVGTPSWQEFMDLAAATNGLLPADLRSDEEVLAKMPLIFRSLRSEQPTEEQLTELFEALKGA
jgi:transcriptional regulator with XRE-family HTH domain